MLLVMLMLNTIYWHTDCDGTYLEKFFWSCLWGLINIEGGAGIYTWWQFWYLKVLADLLHVVMVFNQSHKFFCGPEG